MAYHILHIVLPIIVYRGTGKAGLLSELAFRDLQSFLFQTF